MNILTIIFYNHIKLTYGIKGAYSLWNEFETGIYNYSPDIMPIETMNKKGFINNDGEFVY
jgi:hypothetical protein